MTPLLTRLIGGEVHAPEPVGRVDLSVAAGRIVAVGDQFAGLSGDEFVDVLDFDGLIIVPGLVDAHVHFLGGGGGDGFDSRIPELQLSDLSRHGVTTALAPLGIDPVSRSLEALLAKARALTNEGITAFIYSGGFRRPLPSLTGSPWRDAYLIPEVRGVKLAIGVERAPTHTRRDLVDLSRELLWVERATGRRLVVHVHLGPLAEGHALLLDVAADLANVGRLVVTHLNRSERHVETAITLARLGAWTDMTTMISPDRGMPGSIPAGAAIARLADAGASLNRVTVSSDGAGSVTEPAADGSWQPFRTQMDSLMDEVRALVGFGFPLGDAVAFATARPAEALGLVDKGRIAVGADADLVGLDPELQVREVFARGRRVVAAGEAVVLGRYERRAG